MASMLDALLGREAPITNKAQNVSAARGSNRRTFLACAAGLLTLVWFLPGIVVRSGLHQRLIASLLADSGVTVRLGKTSLGWLRPIALRDVELSDAAGNQILLAPAVTGSKTLLAHLCCWSDLGSFRVEQPRLQVVFSETTSNVETALASLAGSSQESSSNSLPSAIAATLQLSRATIVLVDQHRDRQWTLCPVELAVTLPSRWSQPVEIELQAPLQEPAVTPGITLATALRLPQAPGEQIYPTGTVNARVDGIPLSIFEPVVRRVEPGTAMAGQLDGQWQCQLDQTPEGAPNIRAAGELTIHSLALRGPWLAEDVLQLKKLVGQSRLSVRGSVLTLEEAIIRSELGMLSATATIDTGARELSDLIPTPLNVSGDLELARLAGLLPNTLGLKDSTRPTKGRLSLALVGKTDHQGGRQFSGRLEVSDLEATRNGQSVRWQEPISIALAVRQAKDAPPVINALRCKSEFVDLTAAGDARQLEIRADLDLDRLTRQLEQFVDVGTARMSGHALGRVRVERQPNGVFSASGALRLDRLCLASGETLAGKATGQGSVRKSGERLHGSADVTLTDLAYVDTHGGDYREPMLRVSCQGAYDGKADLLQLEKLKMMTAELGCEASGTITQLRSRQELKLGGMLAYDLERLSTRLRPLVGGDWNLTGRDQRSFQLSASIAELIAASSAETTAKRTVWHAVSARGGIGWQSANALGFRAGPAELQAQCRDAWLRFEPLACAVNGGQVRAQPRLQLAPQMILYHDRGKLVEKVTITPEICAGALQYVAPVVAGCVRVDGELSVDLERAAVPLDNVQLVDASGRLVLHSLRVEESPLLSQISRLFGRPGTFYVAQDSEVPFRLANGRVHHRNMRLEFPDFLLTTSGSVGLDGTLDLVAEIVLGDKPVGSLSYAAALSGQPVRLPIRGTLQRPVIDSRALQAATADVLQRSANELLLNNLGNQLDRMFKRK